MEMSKRVTGITGGGSDGWALFYKARDMIARGIDVTELTIGEHDIQTDPTILKAMYDAAAGGHTGYPDVPGATSLRQAVAERITKRTGMPTSQNNVLITPGAQAGLFAAHIAACNPGDRALYCDPYYATYPGTIRAAGAEPVAVATSPDNAFQPTHEALSENAKGATSLLINSPNNPTGVVYSRSTTDDIARVCIDQDLWLISDEVYDTQVWQGEHISPRTLPHMRERTIVIGSMSKSHAMTGSRIGWVVAPKPMISHLATLAIHTTYGVAGFIQDGALFALKQGHALEEKIAEPFRRRRDIVIRAIASQNVVRLVPSSGAMYAMLDIRATGLSGEEFADALLMQERIAVMPGESFGACAVGHVRVAMTIEDSRFNSAFERLLDFAKGLTQ